MLGQQAFERSGLGAPTATAALQDELEHHKQPVLDLTRRIEELGSGRSPLGRASITLQRRAVAELVLSLLRRRRLLLSVGVTCGEKVIPVALGISCPARRCDDIDGEHIGENRGG